MESSVAALIGGLLLLDEGKENVPGPRAKAGDRAGGKGVGRCRRTGRVRCKEEGSRNAGRGGTGQREAVAPRPSGDEPVG